MLVAAGFWMRKQRVDPALVFPNAAPYLIIPCGYFEYPDILGMKYAVSLVAPERVRTTQYLVLADNAPEAGEHEYHSPSVFDVSDFAAMVAAVPTMALGELLPVSE
jgi:hypothetical protein